MIFPDGSVLHGPFSGDGGLYLKPALGRPTDARSVSEPAPVFVTPPVPADPLSVCVREMGDVRSFMPQKCVKAVAAACARAQKLHVAHTRPQAKQSTSQRALGCVKSSAGSF